MYEIDVYGEIIPSEFDWAGGFSLNKLKAELKEANGDDIQININSRGGDVNEGLAIYSRLRKYASENGAKITTVTDGNCASIATIIFLAGDTRKLNQYIEPFVHNAWTYTAGDADDVKKTADQLERVNEIIGNFYADHTELTYEEARALMDADTFITPEEALEMRFCTQLDEIIRPAALQRFNQPKHNKMEQNNPKFTKEHESMLTQFMNFLKGKETPKNLKVKTAANIEIDFPDIENESDIAVGVKALVDGKQESGSYLMNSKETYIIEKGVLTDIKEPINEEVVSNLKAELAEKETELEGVKAQLTEVTENYNSAKAEMQKHVDILNELKNMKPDGVVENNEPPQPEKEPENKFSKAILNLKNI